jgi:hypothetical protein
MKKKLLLLLAIVLITGTVLFLMNWFKPHKTADDQKAVASLTATELFNAFSADEPKANATYLNQVIEVTGVLEKIDTGETGQKIYYLATGDMLGTISCTFSKGTVMSTAVGETISLKGICDGYLTDVVLKQCVLAD